MELQIASGKLTPGMRLPSVRELAAYAKVNPNTLQKALAELENLKLIYTERTNGKFVTNDTKLLQAMRQKFADNLVKKYLQDMQSLGFERLDAIKYLKTQGGKSDTAKIR